MFVAMPLTEILKGIVAVVFIGGLLLLLGAIIRFSILSPHRTRGGRQRLRRPDVRGLEALCGFPPPPELVAFYKDAPCVERTEISLLDESQTPPKEWFIGTFTPLTMVDVREEIKVSGVKGLPIGTDLEKGTYYIDPTGSVRLYSPNVEGNDILVAASVGEFARFKIQEPADDEE